MTLTVWDRITKALKERGKTQAWLADQLGIKPGAIGNWKRRGIVPAAKFPDIALVFGESIDWVAGTAEPRGVKIDDFSAMALRIAQDFDKLKTAEARLDAFARCISAISRAADSEPPKPE